MGSVKGDAPDPPDYRGAAQETAEGNIELLNAQTEANRPNQYTPFGSSTWSGGGSTPWEQTVTLAPNAQSALDSQLRMQALRSGTGAEMYSRVADDLGEPIDWSSSEFEQFGPTAEIRDPGDPEMFRQEVGDAIYDQYASRLDPMWDQRQRDTEVRMRNQGLLPGDTAYNDLQGNTDRAMNDAYQTAQNAAITGAGAEASRAYGDKLMYSDQMFNQDLAGSEYQTRLRQQQIAEDLQRRGASLNEINALISGQQVGMPTMPSFSNAGVASGPDYLGAAQQQYQGDINSYNAQQQGLQGLFGGLTSLGGLALL